MTTLKMLFKTSLFLLVILVVGWGWNIFLKKGGGAQKSDLFTLKDALADAPANDPNNCGADCSDCSSCGNCAGGGPGGGAGPGGGNGAGAGCAM